MNSATPFSFLEQEHSAYREESFQEVGDQDVIFGRGGKSYGHPGNRLFRRLISHNKELYESLKKPTHRQFVALSIVQAIQRSGGKFLRKQENGKEELWKTVSVKEACIKTSQALRDANVRTKRESQSNAKRSDSDARNDKTYPMRQQAVVSPTYSSEVPQTAPVVRNVSLPAVPSLNVSAEPAISETNLDELDHIDLETIHTLVRSLGGNNNAQSQSPTSSRTQYQRPSLTRLSMTMRSVQNQELHREARPATSRLSFTVRDWFSKEAAQDTKLPPTSMHRASFTRCSVTSLSLLESSLFSTDFDLDDFEIDEALAAAV